MKTKILSAVICSVLLSSTTIALANQPTEYTPYDYNLRLVKNFPYYASKITNARESENFKNFAYEDHSISPFEAYRKLIKSAKNEIVIENFYITPNGDNAAFSKLIDQIKEKAKEGVQVYIVVNWYLGYTENSNKKVLDSLNAYSPNIHVKVSDYYARNPAFGGFTYKSAEPYPKYVFSSKSSCENNDVTHQITFIESGNSINNAYVKVNGKCFQDYNTGGIIHAKTMVVDGKSFFMGSQNFGPSEFTDNHELGVLHLSSDTKRSSNLDQQAQVIRNSIMKDFADADIKNYNIDKQYGGDSIFKISANEKDQPIIKYQGKNTTNHHMNTFVAVSPGAGTNQPLTKHRATYKGGYNPQLNYALSNEEKSLFDLINSARHSIDMQAMNVDFYNFYNGSKHWNSMVDLLKKKIKEGVHVRISAAARNFAHNEPGVGWKELLDYAEKQGKSNLVEMEVTNFRTPAIDKGVACIDFSMVDHYCSF